MGTTTNYGWEYPDDGADTNTWGAILTTMFQQQDADLKTVSNSAASASSAASTANTLATRAAPTGAVMDFLLPTPPTGWTVLNGTIGNTGSGADRANADAQALFTALWSGFSDALMPMLTSAGAASSRGASAAADWAANKRLTMTPQVGKFRRSYLSGTTQDIGATVAQNLPAHTHDIALRQTSGGGTNVASSSGGSSFTGTTASAGSGSELYPAHGVYLTCIKL